MPTLCIRIMSNVVLIDVLFKYDSVECVQTELIIKNSLSVSEV